MHSLHNVQEKMQRPEGTFVSVHLSTDYRMFQLENNWTDSDEASERLA
jgi:hypothetical protein